MAMKFAGSLSLFLVTTLVLAIAMANNKWQWPGQGQWPGPGQGQGQWPGPGQGYCWRPCREKNTKREIVVGEGQQNSWHFLYNYSDWAEKNGPFYLNDVLVFKYDPPVLGRPFNHSVYMLRDYPSYLNCSLEGATRLGDVYAGANEGFKLELKMRPFAQPYLLACGEKNGLHCNVGLMKFMVWPMWRPGSN